MLHQHRFRAAGQQAAGHCQAVEQRLRMTPAKTVQLQLVGAQEISHRRRFFQQEVTDLLRHDAAFLRVAHDRVTQVQRMGVDGLDTGHAAQNGPALRRTAQVTGQNRITVAQLADGGDSVDQRRNLLGSQHFPRPLAILSVVGELHRVQRPYIHPDALHRKNRCAVAGMAENHVGLDGE